MRGYQPLTSEIQVPEEWPVEDQRPILIDVVQFAIERHLLGHKVVIIIAKVFAVITDNLNRPGFLLKKIEEIDHEITYKIELVIPIKTVVTSLKPRTQGRGNNAESVQLLPCHVRSQHPISIFFHGRFNPDTVFIVAPDLKRILQLNGITGPEMYNHVLLTIYRIYNINSLDVTTPSEEPGTSAGTLSIMDQVTDDEVDIVYYDRLMPPKRRWCFRKPTFTWTLGFLVLVGLILYLIVCINKIK